MTEGGFKPRAGDVVAVRATVTDAHQTVLGEWCYELGTDDALNLHHFKQGPPEEDVVPWRSAAEIAAMEKVIEAARFVTTPEAEGIPNIDNLIDENLSLMAALSDLDAIRGGEKQ